MAAKKRKKPTKPRSLTPRMRAFIREYLIEPNGTQAAIAAGYAEKSAAAKASQLLKDPRIAAELEIKQIARSKRTDIKADRVLLELARIAFSRMDDVAKWGPDGVELIDSATLTEDQARAVSKVTESKSQYGGRISIELHDKTRALELIAKHLGMLTENVNLKAEVGGVMIVPGKMDTEDWTQLARRHQALQFSKANRDPGRGNGSNGNGGP